MRSANAIVHDEEGNSLMWDSRLSSPQNANKLGTKEIPRKFEVLPIRSQEISGISGSGTGNFNVDPEEALNELHLPFSVERPSHTWLYLLHIWIADVLPIVMCL